MLLPLEDPMSTRRVATVSLSAMTLGLFLGLAGCASEPKAAAAAGSPSTPSHAEISNDLTATAKVVALDKSLRSVTLRGEDGRLIDVHAGDEVRNFDQIAVGDTLRVHYRQVLAATLLPAGSEGAPAGAAIVAARAKAGAKPGGGVGAQVSLRVNIVSVDAQREVVVFSLPSGELVAHRIQTPEGREFVKGLKLGDLVQLDYTEALALSIDTLPAG
jgi:hypothetical protein